MRTHPKEAPTLPTEKAIHRVTILVDSDTRNALRRLAEADVRSASSEVRTLIRAEAVRRGVWSPERKR